MSKNQNLSKLCKQCGLEFHVKPCEYARRIYCSRACHGKGLFQTMFAAKGKQKPNSGSFQKGRGKGKRLVEYIPLTCANCKKEFERPPFLANPKYYKKDKSFCSVACLSEYRKRNESRAGSAYWVGGKKTYRGRDWEQKRLLVIKKQKGKCAVCKKHLGQSLPIHHIRPYREFEAPSEANRIENLVGLCPSCHMKVEGFPKGQRSAGRAST